MANPPYSVSAFKNTLNNGEKSFELYNRLTDDSSEIECLFIERAKQLLKPGGWAGIILPSSILSNSGIYTDAREIILKYFNIKAITEFGSNTFMATGTNTVTLFLERKANNEWKKIEQAIKRFFDKSNEATVNGIEKAFSKYVVEIFEDIELEDYITLVNKNPNDSLQQHEIFADYTKWFKSLTEIKELKKKRVFKNKTQEEQQAELDKLFYEKVFAKEQDKMLYFFLAYPQETVLVKVGEKKAEKEFIGYEFSNRRGHEGIKMYRDDNEKLTTKLYDEENCLNPEKANSYIYQAFLGESQEIADSLKDNLTNFMLVELIDFKKLAFEKSVSLGIKKKVQIKSKWKLVKLKDICQVKIGGTPSRKESRYYFNGTNSWVSISEMNTQTIFDTKEKITDEGVKKSNVKLIKAGTTLVSFKLSIGKTAIAGIDLYTNEAIAGLELKNEDRVINKYVFYLFNTQYINLDKDTMNAFGKSLNSTLLKEIEIPLPPKEIQEKIISEIEAVEKIEQKLLSDLDELNNSINNQFSNLEFTEVNLGSIANFKNGLNYSAKSKGELVTVVGVKDFLENFSPDIDKLEQVKIDGELNESYKLQPGDILVVRSNGSANLVGRFIYIDRLLTETSYSGFTIRIRANLEQVNSKYLCYCLRTEKVRNKITRNPQGANIKSINQTMLSSISIPLAPLDEQLKIITNIKSVEKEINQINNKLTSIDVEKKLILKKYLE